MAIQYVGGVSTGRAGNTGSTSQSLTSLSGGIGAAPIEGDLVIVTVCTGTAGRTPSALISGYTQLPQVNSNGTGFDTSLGVSYKFMGGTPDTSVTIPATGNSNDAQRWTVRVYRGVDPTTPLDVTEVSASGTGTTRANPPSIAPVTDGAVIVCVGAGADGGASAFTFGDLTDVIGGATADTNDAVIASGHKTDWVSGAFDCAASTSGSTNSAASWAAYSIVLRPFIPQLYDGPIRFVGRVTGTRLGELVGDFSQSLTSLTGGIGSAPVEGDFVVVTLVSGDIGTFPTYSISGYEKLGQLERIGDFRRVCLCLFTKFMGETPDTSISIPPSGSGSAPQAWIISVYRGVNTISKFDVTPESVTGPGTAPNPAPITPVTDGAWVHMSAGVGSDNSVALTFAGLTEYTQVLGADSYHGRAVDGYYSGWASGEYDIPVSSTGDSLSDDAWAAYTVALRPGPIPITVETNQTLSAFGSTASGTVTVQASVSQTVPAFGQSAIVNRVSVLTAAQTVSVFTQTLTAEFGEVRATASQTVPVFGRTQTAGVLVKATASQTVPVFGKTQTGEVVVKATASQTVPVFGKTQTGTVVASGTASQSISVFGATATATALVSFQATQTVPSFGQDASMDSNPKLTANQTVPVFDSTAIGAVLVKVEAGQTVPVFGSTGSLDALVSLAATQDVPAFEQGAALHRVSVVSASQDIPAFGKNQTGRVIVEATVSQSVPEYDQTATAVVVDQVFGAQVVPAFGSTASMLSLVTSAAEQAVPAFGRISAATVLVDGEGVQLVPPFGEAATGRAIVAAASSHSIADFDQTLTAFLVNTLIAAQLVPVFGSSAEGTLTVTIQGTQGVPVFGSAGSLSRVTLQDYRVVRVSPVDVDTFANYSDVLILVPVITNVVDALTDEPFRQYRGAAMTTVSKTFLKRPADVQDYDVDFSQYLEGLDDTLNTFTVTAEDGITVDSTELATSTVVKIWLSGGSDDERYIVTVQITTGGGRTKEVAFAVRVNE